MKPLITIRNLRVQFGDTAVLSGVDADLARNQITALIGLNGSGKTTLLRTLLKEIPYEGEIHFHCGHDHRRPKPEHIGYVPQKLRFEAQLPLTVRDLLALALQKRPLFFGVSRGVEQRMIDMLRLVGAPPVLLDRFVEKVSGGELQRVLLALALEPKPELLLLDEPAAGVDFQDQEPFYDMIARLVEERQVTIVLVSHELSVVSRHAHHVLCLNNGRIQCQGPPHDVLNSDTIRATFGEEQRIFDHHGH